MRFFPCLYLNAVSDYHDTIAAVLGHIFHVLELLIFADLYGFFWVRYKTIPRIFRDDTVPPANSVFAAVLPLAEVGGNTWNPAAIEPLQ